METTRIKCLKIALVIVGLIFIFGLPLLMFFWPSGWTWLPRQYEYEQMIMVVYATLGAFLIYASNKPHEHRSLIWFTIISSYLHAAVMFAQAMLSPADHANLYGDIPGLFIIAIVLTILMSIQKRDSKNIN